MRKNWRALACLTMACAMTCGAFVGCGGDSGGGSGAAEGMISVKPLDDLGVAEQYMPSVDNIQQRVGKIKVVILFDGTLPGWQAAAKEYERLHDGQVKVNLDSQYNSSNYAQKLNEEFTANSDWDIVQGNLGYGQNTQNYCYNMNSAILTKNAYAGNQTWSAVLREEAYISDKTGGTSDTFIMNSEDLQTAWFINEVALAAAGEQGYENADGEVANPVTWDDMMFLCECMQEAGYETPLGISLSPDSITASQFTWLLRVYGDFYYRNEYNYIMAKSGYQVDLTDPEPEKGSDYNYLFSSLFNLIVDEYDEGGLDNYVGGTSDKFIDFLEQFGKMSDFLHADALDSSFEDMRTKFYAQANKAAPQIILDYAGEGLYYLKGEKEDVFKMDFFDYPIMESDFVEEGTLLRDVGGNGGYLSIMKHGTEQNELVLDFMKFFMSPYGQTVYYKGLSEGNGVPKGLTTVVNDMVVMPEEWKTFFETDKISFTGLSDANPFVSYFLRGIELGSSTSLTSRNIAEYWRGYLKGHGGDAITAEEFGGYWQDDTLKDVEAFAAERGWAKDCWTRPGESVQ